MKYQNGIVFIKNRSHRCRFGGLAAYGLAAFVFFGGMSFVSAQDLSQIPQQLSSQSLMETSIEPSQTAVTDAFQGAVAMPDRYSAQAAIDILQQGGNAVDAAVASAFVLAVSYPEAGNIGGGGFMTLFTPSLTPKFDRPVEKNNIAIPPLDKNPQNAYFLDYREKAPKAVHRDLYLDQNAQVIPYKSLIGYQASGVPGTVMGLWGVHQQFGSLPWQQLLEPAIHLAKTGVEIAPAMQQTADWFEQWLATKAPESAKSELNFARFWQQQNAGRLVQPTLAQTLERIAELGAQEFYLGKTATILASQMQQFGGADYPTRFTVI